MRKTLLKRLLLVVAAIMLASLISLGFSKYGLAVSRYTISSPGITAPMRIVQLSDLHNSLFGENNRRLTAKVAAEEPDLILITGDLLNQKEERTDVAVDLIRQLSAVAPVYVSWGNHEQGYESRYNVSLKDLYQEAGATVLDYEWAEIGVNGQTVRLGGVYGYGLPKELHDEAKPMEEEFFRFLLDFEDTAELTILMCHMPVSWLRYGSLNSWDIDYVFAGHDHGGQIRIPFVGGLWAPDQGWFPGRECGLYFSEDGESTLILTRGLGNTDKYPRFNNIPEIVTVDFKAGEKPGPSE